MVLSVRDLNSDNVPQKSWAASTSPTPTATAPSWPRPTPRTPSGEPVVRRQGRARTTTDAPALELDPAGRVLRRGARRATWSPARSSSEIDFQDDERHASTRPTRARTASQLDNLVKRAAFALRFGDANLLISEPAHRRLEDPLHPRHPGAGRDAGPVPPLRRRPVPGDPRRPDPVGARRLHDHRPLPVRAAGRHRAARRRQRARPRLQLRAQLGEGGGRRLRRHGRLLRHAGRRPDHRGLPRRLPEAVHGLRGHARRTCKEHLRYPEDLFRVQTNMWGDYHIEDPTQFYGGNDQLGRRPRPGHRRRGGGHPHHQRARRHGRHVPQRPHRPVLPVHPAARRRRQPEFVLLRPFVPDVARGRQPGAHRVHGRQERRRRLREAPGVRDAARASCPNGPALVQGEIQRDAAVSEQETLLGGRGLRRCRYGSLTAIPIDGGLVYVRPFYVTSDADARCPASRR